MKKKISLLITGLLLFAAAGFCVAAIFNDKPAAEPVSRDIELEGNWSVKSAGDESVGAAPAPSYNLTLNPDGSFALNFNGLNSRGTYVLSGTTIQLTPTGKNYRFEFGPTRKEDRIIGDEMIWTRDG